MIQKRKILLVDDQGDIIEIMMNILNEYYTCKVANTGKKALEILSKTSDIELILLDVNMPEMDGYEVCRRIKAETRLKDIPIIFITGYTDGEKIVKGFEVGGQDYITKPFNPNELLARVNTHMVINKDLLLRVERSEERYRAIFLSSSAIVLVSLEGLILDANLGFVQLFEYENAQEVIGKSVIESTVEIDKEMAKQKLKQVVDNYTKPVQFSLKSYTRTGKIKNILLSITRCSEKCFEEDFLVAVITDVSENKELALKIEVSERRLKEIADNIEEIFWLISIEGTVKMVNSAFGDVFKSNESILGENFWELPIWNENECLIVKQKIKEMLDEEIQHFSIETNWHLKSGTTRICRNNFSLVPDDTGAIKNFAIITQDITRYKKFAEKERIQQIQLRQADKMTSLGVLVAGIAHEINNPNNLIMLNSAFLKKVWWDIVPVLEKEAARNPDFRLNNLEFEIVKDKFYQLMNSISMGSDRIKNIVHSLKDFVRADTGRLDNNISINNVVKDAVIIVQNAISKVTDRFTVEYGENIPMVKGNTQQLEQVVVNLLTNSCQALASAKKGIMIKTSYSDSEVMVIVYDDGEGMSEEVMKQMRDPFFTTKRDQGGTGLGLSVSHSIMEAHGGRLEYKSVTGIGTEAQIIIPAVLTGGETLKLSGESCDAVQ